MTQAESDGESIPQIKAKPVREKIAQIIPAFQVTQSESDGESKIELACDIVIKAEKTKQSELVGELVIQDDVVFSCVMTEIMFSPTVSFFSILQRHF